MSMLLYLALLGAPAFAADPDGAGPGLHTVSSWATELATGDPARIKSVFEDARAPADVRLLAAALLLNTPAAPDAGAPDVEAPEVDLEADEPSPLDTIGTAKIPLSREDLACDKDGRVVRVMPVGGYATLNQLDVEVQDDVVLVRGTLDRAAGRPLHYLVEGGNAAFPSRYVVSMVGVKSGLSEPIVPVGSDLVRSVQVVERDGAIIVVVNSSQDRALRVDFEQRGEHFLIALRVARRPVG